MKTVPCGDPGTNHRCAPSVSSDAANPRLHTHYSVPLQVFDNNRTSKSPAMCGGCSAVHRNRRVLHAGNPLPPSRQLRASQHGFTAHPPSTWCRLPRPLLRSSLVHPSSFPVQCTEHCSVLFAALQWLLHAGDRTSGAGS